MISHVDPAFTVPLFDLSEVDIEFSGVFAPEPERNSEKVGITEQFLKNAEIYDKGYARTEHFLQLIQQGIDAASFKADAPKILDIGSGSGVNSVVPLLQIFPKADITAIDLSPNLLLILKKCITTHSLSSKVRCVCVSADKCYFPPGYFDFAFGGYILRHIIEPSETLKSANYALRKGGIAVFPEPFETGHSILGLTFRRILDESRKMGLDEPIYRYTLTH